MVENFKRKTSLPREVRSCSRSFMISSGDIEVSLSTFSRCILCASLSPPNSIKPLPVSIWLLSPISPEIDYSFAQKENTDQLCTQLNLFILEHSNLANLFKEKLSEDVIQNLTETYHTWLLASTDLWPLLRTESSQASESLFQSPRAIFGQTAEQKHFFSFPTYMTWPAKY